MIAALPSGNAAAGAGIPIGIDRVCKRLGGKDVLRDVDLQVGAGEFLTLLGPSGSGKTTLLMATAGFAPPDSGAVSFAGRDVTDLPPFRREIGIVFQSYALFPHLSVGENVAYPLSMRRVDRVERARRVEETLALVRLQCFGSRTIASLSGGQRQRVALARAIVFRPKILLMDEPLSALDKPLRDAMQVELRRLHATLGMTTVYVTHDQREALSLSDRIAVMNHGEIVQIDRPMDLYTRPATGFVARFLGESSLLPVALRGQDVLFEGRPIQLARPPARGPAHALLIRPERLARVDTTLPGPANRFEGTVTDVILQGDSCLVTVRLTGGRTIDFREKTGSSLLNALPQAGDGIVLGLDPADSIVVVQDPTDAADGLA